MDTSARPTEQVNTFDNLKGQQFLSLTTFRKTGVGVPTPVWFAQQGNTLYIGTGANSGKVKRIRNKSQVTVAPCTRSGQITGPAVEAQARILQTPSEKQTAEQALATKYGISRKAYYGVMSAVSFVRRKPLQEQCYLAVEKP